MFWDILFRRYRRLSCRSVHDETPHTSVVTRMIIARRARRPHAECPREQERQPRRRPALTVHLSDALGSPSHFRSHLAHPSSPDFLVALSPRFARIFVIFGQSHTRCGAIPSLYIPLHPFSR